jgi:RNA polymerase-binding transcription factor DksA
MKTMVKNVARYSDLELQEFKELIEKKLNRALEEFNYVNNQIDELNDSNGDRDSGDFMDDSNKQMEIELLNSMLFRQKQFIRNLENALIRIRNKTYGICTVTGQLIDKNRLKLVPHATKSVAGKNSETNQNRTDKEKKQSPNKPIKSKSFSKVIRKNSPKSEKKQSNMLQWEIEDENDFEDFTVDAADLVIEDNEQNFND